jgi:hypothetical protein
MDLSGDPAVAGNASIGGGNVYERRKCEYDHGRLV